MTQKSTVQPLDVVPKIATRRLRLIDRFPQRFSTPVALIVLIIAWEIFGRISDALFFPPMSGIIVAWWKIVISGEMSSAMTASLQALAVGFGLAVLLGVAIGTGMGLSKTFKYLVDIYVNTLMAAPLIALIPIIAVLFGLDVWARAAVVFLFSFFVITLNAEAGMKATSSELVEMGHSFGLSRRRIFFVIILPAALPALMAGLRLGVIRAVKGMVTAELFMSLIGLGALVDQYGKQFKAEELFAVLLTIIAVSMIAGAAIHQLDRHLTHWQQGIARE